MDAIFDEYAGQFAPIRLHVNWPNANDIFYLYNPIDVNQRRGVYAVNYVPTFRFDGKYLADPSDFGTNAQWYAYVRSTLDELLLDDAKFRINMDQTIVGDSVHVSFDVVPTEIVDAEFNILLAVTEDTANVGYYIFRHVLRDMVPDAVGETVAITTGDSLHFDWAYRIPNMQTDIYATVLVQKPINKRIMQAARQKIPSVVTEVASAEPPLRLLLGRNMPNPFNPSTTISYSLDRTQAVRLAVYDQAGRLVDELVRGRESAGAHSVVWDGRDRSGRDVGSGVYFYRLETDRTSQTHKMILIR